MYYYLKSQQNNIQNNFVVKTGAPSINLSNFIDMYNPKIPSLEKQKEIVTYCDNLSGMITNMENQIIENDKLMKDTMNMFMKSFSKSKTD